MEKHQDELKWLYMELYGNDSMYAELCGQMYEYYRNRSAALKKAWTGSGNNTRLVP